MFGFLFQQRQWALYNPMKSWLLQGLTTREAQLVVATMTAHELALVLVWNKKWEVWKSLNSSDAKTLRHVRTYDIGAPEVQKNIHEAHEITQVHSHHLEPQSELTGIMKYSWRPISVPVEIIGIDKKFSTKTTEVSEVAILFEDPLPDWVSGYFNVAMTIDQKNIEVTCGLVEDQRGAKVFVEVVETADEESGLKAYRDWVMTLSPRQ